MQQEELLNELTLDDLQEDYRGIAELIGIDNLILLCKNYGGNPQYIPLLENLLKPSKYQNIIKEFDGYNIKKLALKYGVSGTTVYRLVRDDIKIKKRSPLEGQISFF